MTAVSAVICYNGVGDIKPKVRRHLRGVVISTRSSGQGAAAARRGERNENFTDGAFTVEGVHQGELLRLVVASPGYVQTTLDPVIPGPADGGWHQLAGVGRTKRGGFAGSGWDVSGADDGDCTKRRALDLHGNAEVDAVDLRRNHERATRQRPGNHHRLCDRLQRRDPSCR